MSWERSAWRVSRYPVYSLLGVWALYLFACSILAPGTLLFRGISTKTLDTALVGIFAAVLAASGWVTTAYISRLNSVKQHTMQVLTQARLSTEMNKRVRDLYDAYPVGKMVPLADVLAATTQEDWYRGATYILNYYEFLSVAMRHNDIYEPLLKDCVRSQLCGTHDKLRHLITVCIDHDPRVKSGEIPPDKSRIYKDIRRVYAVWSA